MSVPSFLINSFGSFLLIIKSSVTGLECFWPFNSMQETVLSEAKTKVRAIGVD